MLIFWNEISVPIHLSIHCFRAENKLKNQEQLTILQSPKVENVNIFKTRVVMALFAVGRVRQLTFRAQ